MTIESLAVVKTNRIGNNTQIASFAYIDEDVVIGADCVIHPHVTIYSGVHIGDGVEIFPGAVIGREPKGAGAVARATHFVRFVSIGSGCSIGPNAVVYFDVTIGINSLIGDGASIREQCKIGDHVIVGRYVTLNYNCRVGNYTKIMDHAWLAGNMTIGNHVFISGGVMTANDNSLGRSGYSEDDIRGPTIEDGASIGVGAVLLPDVHIGQRAVVAANAVVTRDVSSSTLVMGIPAVFVRIIEEKQ